VEYEKRKGLAGEFLEVLSSLDVLDDGRQLSEKVICNYLLDRWWDLRFSPGKRPIYLAFAEVHELSREIAKAGGAIRSSLQLEEGAFSTFYGSVAPRAKDRRVCFFLHRNQAAVASGKKNALHGANHFFPVVFDYLAKRAHCFGVVPVQQPEIQEDEGGESDWGHWMGPQLWSLIGQEMGWGDVVGDAETVTVVTKNWPQVSQTLPHGCT